MKPDWYQTLEQLVATGYDPDATATGGAQLDFHDTDGVLQFTAPLARHVRLDDDCVWIRPIHGTGPAFELGDSPRRGLPIGDVTHTPHEIRLVTADGVVTISPATADLIEVLEAWDTYVLTQLDATVETALARLEEDSPPE